MKTEGLMVLDTITKGLWYDTWHIKLPLEIKLGIS